MSRVIEIKVMTAATIKNKIGITLLRLSSVVIKLFKLV
ncbi:hypothetical protein PHG01_01278 [Streptococcus mutans PKUSS-HG01]|nr:hypothetical protein PHG01_01278 [Streptococcus mutans PKUSS-HG01]